MRDLLRAIAALEPSRVEGSFWRHCSLRWPELEGSFAGGRWNRPNTYPTVYLGRPPDSVTAEAYRHLVDDEMDQAAEIAAELVVERKFLRCAVAVQNILDLRPAGAADAVGLSPDDLRSEVGTTSLAGELSLPHISLASTEYSRPPRRDSAKRLHSSPTYCPSSRLPRSSRPRSGSASQQIPGGSALLGMAKAPNREIAARSSS